MRGTFALGILVCAACSPATTSSVVEVSAAHPENVAPLGPMEPLNQSSTAKPEAKIPFANGQTWTGYYDCAQGRTELTLNIVEVKGNAVHAIFDFDHPRSGAYGSFYIDGRYDAKTSRMTMTPGAWIEHPQASYVSVGMIGEVKEDTYSGKIDNDTCGDFVVTYRSEGDWDIDD
jgi:hypothetical protein